MNNIEKLLSEYREKLLPLAERMSRLIELLKPEMPLPEQDIHRVTAEAMESSCRNLMKYLTNPDDYYDEQAKLRNRKWLRLDARNQVEIPCILASDIRCLLSGIYYALELLEMPATDVSFLANPLHSSQKDYLSELLMVMQNALVVVDDIERKSIDQTE